MKDNPPVTIILPIRNEAAYIERCLNAIQCQDYPGEVEIIIVDGMSTDDTRAILEKIIIHHSALILLENPAKIVPTGINIALRQAKGEIIIRVDGHTLIASDYVRQCIETLQSSGAENVGGRMNAVGSSFFGKVVALATSTPFGIGSGKFHYSDKKEWVDTVYMGAWPRQVFEKIGLFDEELVRDQDDEFNYRLREFGGKILLSPDIKSEYTVRGDPVKLWRQYFQYGFWKVRVLQKHPRQMSLRQFVPPVFVLALIFSFLLPFFSFFFAPSSSFIFYLSSFFPLLYLFANLGASLWTASRRGWRSLPLLPIIFAILHLSYGLGFLVGLFKFWNRWGDKVGKVPVWSNETIG